MIFVAEDGFEKFPIVAGHSCMSNSNSVSFRSFDFQGDRCFPKGFCHLGLLLLGEVFPEPFSALSVMKAEIVGCVSVSAVMEGSGGEFFVVANDSKHSGEPLGYKLVIRPSVDEVSNRNKNILFFVEPNLFELGFEQFEASVNVSYHPNFSFRGEVMIFEGRCVSGRRRLPIVELIHT
jgi:hypothetical protein